MVKVSGALLRVWVYRELMGTLDYEKRVALQNALDEKQKRGELDSLERRIWSAMKLHDNRKDQREFLKKELRAWEKRTAT